MSFTDNANKAFDKLYIDWLTWSQYQDFDRRGPGYWHMANTMHSCLDYYAVVRPEKSRTDHLMKIIQDCYAMFMKHHDYQTEGYWYDDYGWFANAFARAAEIPLFLSEQTNPKRSEAINVAKLVWSNYNGFFCNQAQFCQGCFSKPMYPVTRSTDASGCNSVTNALYLDFSMRLHGLLGDIKYLNAAKKQYQLFLVWIGNQTQNGLLNNESGTRVNLVRWGNGSQYVDGQSNWVWSGNQGLLFSGLSLLGVKENDMALHIITQSLYKGFITHLFDEKNVLHEAPFNRNFNEDPLDYATGKGVVLRFISGTGKVEADDVKKITDTASAAYKVLNGDTFSWSQDNQATLNFQNKFLKMWRPSTYSPLPSPITWGHSPSHAPTYQVVSDMCILDAQVAAIRVEKQATKK